MINIFRTRSTSRARTVGVLGQHDNAEAEMPGMLGIVLRAPALSIDGLAEDFLQLIGFSDELDLLNQT